MDVKSNIFISLIWGRGLGHGFKRDIYELTQLLSSNDSLTLARRRIQRVIFGVTNSSTLKFRNAMIATSNK
jgi:hypothetical protein